MHSHPHLPRPALGGPARPPPVGAIPVTGQVINVGEGAGAGAIGEAVHAAAVGAAASPPARRPLSASSSHNSGQMGASSATPPAYPESPGRLRRAGSPSPAASAVAAPATSPASSSGASRRGSPGPPRAPVPSQHPTMPLLASQLGQPPLGGRSPVAPPTAASVAHLVAQTLNPLAAVPISDGRYMARNVNGTCESGF